MLGVGLPEINEGLKPAVRADRAAEITRYVTDYKAVTQFLAEKEYPKLVKAIDGWTAGPATGRVRVVELLAAHLEETAEVGLVGNTVMKVLPHPSTGPQGAADGVFNFTVHDVFIVGGKAAWAIEKLIGIASFPAITAAQTNDERTKNARLIQYTIVRAYKAGVTQATAKPK